MPVEAVLLNLHVPMTPDVREQRGVYRRGVRLLIMKKTSMNGLRYRYRASKPELKLQNMTMSMRGPYLRRRLI